jgi:hypothetical protein
MTVNNQTVEVKYTADGTQVDFPITFAIIDPIQVLWSPVGGSVIEAGADDWVVRYDSPPLAGTEIIVYRDTPITQETEYRPYSAFPAESTENALDKLTEISQELEYNKADKVEVHQNYVKREGDTMKDANTGLDMAGGMVTGLPDPSEDSDAVNRKYYFDHLQEGPVGPIGPEGPEGPIGPEGPEGPKGDKGNPGSGGFDPSADETVTGKWTMLNPANVFYGDGSNLTDIPAPDLGLYATKIYSDDGDITTLSSANAYTDTEIANIPTNPPGVQLGNTETWTHGQYNQLHIPSKTGSGASTRFTWDAEVYPVASLSSGSEMMFMCAPGSPSVNGMFIAITWLSLVGDQVWTLDQDKFGTNVVAPENNGEDVTRIFWSKFGKWYDV